MRIGGFFLFLLGLALVFSSCQRPPQKDTGQTPPTASAEEALSSAPPEHISSAAQSLVQDPPAAQTDDADPVSEVLSADLTPGETSSRLLALLPTTPADDRAFLVQLAGNYCPDEEYWRLLPFLLDRNQPEDCREELLRDLLRRPDAVRLRPLYRLALDPSHPLSQEAKEYLFSYLQDVPENDFNALAREVQKAEKENR